MLLSAVLFAAGPAFAQAPRLASSLPAAPVPAGEASQSAPGISPMMRGSVPSQAATDQPLPLSLDNALERGLRHNLGTITSEQAFRQTEAARILALSQLLPNVSGSLRETVTQVNLRALGFSLDFPPGLGISTPSVVGPFSYFDLRGTMTQKLADLNAIRTYQSSREAQRASQFSARDAREMVVYAVTAGYLQVIASAARVESARAQLATAEAIYQQAADRFASGLSARIDRTRSQVELQMQRQRLTFERAEFAKQKIALTRLIGLPPGQDVVLTDLLPYAPLENLTLDEAIALAAQNRQDLKAAEARVRSATLSRKAASAGHFPTLEFAADYGVIGLTPSNSHGTFSVTGQLKFPIWSGNRIKADIERADATLQQRRAELADLRAGVEAEVRTAFLDLAAAAEQVQAAESRRELAQDQLVQASDRFVSGGADTVEVVQAQEAVASAEQDYIASLHAHNLAKGNVARATGQAEKIMRQLLGSR